MHASQITNLACSRFAIKTLGITRLRHRERHVDEHLKKRNPPLVVQGAHLVAICRERANQTRKHDRARVGHDATHLTSPADVFAAIFAGKRQIAIESMAQIVAVDAVTQASRVSEHDFDRDRDRALARAGKPGEPHHRAALLQQAFTIDAEHLAVVPGDIGRGTRWVVGRVSLHRLRGLRCETQTIPYRPTVTSLINEPRLTHLRQLEAESIQIFREVAASFEKPVMLYSIGKDSAVLLHLARKAFFPANPPFPLLHVDTTWKFKDMYRLRDEYVVKELGLELLVHINQEGLAAGIGPISHGSRKHTDVMKTQALKQALDKYGFDAAFGGARRDEEKSRAKERIFSFRDANHRWEPRQQRPELWSIFNTEINRGESIRVFPLSNWTELDVWQYIWMENIRIVPLYLAAPRPVVYRQGVPIMVDDDRLVLEPGEQPQIKVIRFRTLGCYPLSGAIESTAATLPDIIKEMLQARQSERQGRLIDHDAAGSMEEKKKEGYF